MDLVYDATLRLSCSGNSLKNYIVLNNTFKAFRKKDFISESKINCE
jgi:hypothetical protein